MSCRARMQLAEALGAANRWFCSQFYGRKIDDSDTLLCYFIRSGGAEDFANRYDKAMGPENRWYCCEFYGYEIHDPEILWNYYLDHAAADLTLA